MPSPLIIYTENTAAYKVEKNILHTPPHTFVYLFESPSSWAGKKK